ncbi:Glucan endo-1,3-beta-glucosidase [Thalictrum thalictroides]|uniref:Glucan endo-1,3-beta-glucosidase n=1 Tax=Thalictrum thalictroides TaxID=46969 RepID=A0A7J6WPA6_THATH|nr:Glucan endo-1,3-beta-glucosidase [Thalictrum thalictroides]
MKIEDVFLLLGSILLISSSSTDAVSTGVCYGQVANNLLSPPEAVNLIKSNGISKVRLFNADPSILQAFSGAGVELMIGVPNEILPDLASGGPDAANQWLQNNLFAHVSADQIHYLAVGNEIFFRDTFYTPFLVPAMRNIHQALQTLNLADKIKLSSPHAASILSSAFPPSAGAFDLYILPELHLLLQFLAETGAPLMVNVYPFFSYVNNPNDIPLNYALFNSGPTVQDNGLVYNNLFDATIDAFVSALEKEGFPGIPVAVTETGWPTSGGEAARPENALAFNSNIVNRASNNIGTPKRPGVGVEVFLFDLFDENEKGGGEYEQHFGIFNNAGVKAYDLNFS